MTEIEKLQARVKELEGALQHLCEGVEQIQAFGVRTGKTQLHKAWVVARKLVPQKIETVEPKSTQEPKCEHEWLPQQGSGNTTGATAKICAKCGAWKSTEESKSE